MITTVSIFHNLDGIVGRFFMSLRTPNRTVFFKAVTVLGNPGFVAVLAVLIVAYLFYKKARKYIGAFIVGTATAEAITFITKILVHRARPLHGLIAETDYSFPSGHATVAVALYGFILFYILSTQTLSTTKKVVAWISTIVIVLLIGISRLYLGVHYGTDILAGYMVGTLGLFIGIDVTQKYI